MSFAKAGALKPIGSESILRVEFNAKRIIPEKVESDTELCVHESGATSVWNYKPQRLYESIWGIYRKTGTGKACAWHKRLMSIPKGFSNKLIFDSVLKTGFLNPTGSEGVG